jgi:hypothetical protein
MGRRKDIVGFAKQEGEPVLLSPVQFQLLADAYGQVLPAVVQGKIALWTGLFSLTMQGERHAASLATVDSELRKIHRAVQSLREKVFGPRERNGAGLSLDVVSKFYAGPHQRRETKDIPYVFIPLLRHALDALLVTSDFLQLNLSRYCPRVERGWSWEMWVGCIYQVLVEHGLAPSVRKDVESLDKISPFVSLIKVLQKELPRGCQRFTASDSALSQGISRVLRKGTAPEDVLRDLRIPKSEMTQGDELKWAARLAGQMQRKKRRKKSRAK